MCMHRSRYAPGCRSTDMYGNVQVRAQACVQLHMGAEEVCATVWSRAEVRESQGFLTT